MSIDTNNQIATPVDVAIMLKEKGTKSAVIRLLHADGYSRSAIVKLFKDSGDPIRYQHVRNVLVTPLKKV